MRSGSVRTGRRPYWRCSPIAVSRTATTMCSATGSRAGWRGVTAGGGPSRPSRAIVSFLTERGIEGRDRPRDRGWRRRDPGRAPSSRRLPTRPIPRSPPDDEAEAAQLLEGSGLQGRVERRFLDIAEEPYDVDAADVVLLDHRVVGRYPDDEKLLGAAGEKAVFLPASSHRPRNVVTQDIAVVGELHSPVEGRQLPGALRIRRRRC